MRVEQTLVVKEILPQGHEDLSPTAPLYMKSMAERNGFTVLDSFDVRAAKPVRIQINHPYLRDPVFLALVAEEPSAK